ncbi:hypothetical protein ABKA04_005453 [Annulohypoxylon sp. FPYF3050]
MGSPEEPRRLLFNADQTRIVEANYRSSSIDIWDCSAPDGSLKFIKSLSCPGQPSPGRKHHRPHQAVLDPTGRYFVAPNLGGDTSPALDSENDLFEIVNSFSVPTAVGPRHVRFIMCDNRIFLTMAGELSNEIYLYEVIYVQGHLDFIEYDRLSSYGNQPPADPSKAALAELLVANNQRDIYVSNRNTGEPTDHIAHFYFNTQPKVRLDYVGRTSSGGLGPRTMALCNDEEEKFLFVGNEAGEFGFVALLRNTLTGVLDPNPVATLKNSELIALGHSEDKIKGP